MSTGRFSPFAILPGLAFVTALTLGACSSSSAGSGGSTCTMGEQKACTCGSETTGTQTCLDTGEFGECSCPGGEGGSGSSSGGAGGDATTDGDKMCNGCGEGGGMPDGEILDAAPGTFGAPCMTNSDCNSMDCHEYPAKGGMFCTQPCEVASDCPPAAGGCNMMGQCKVP